VRHFWKAMYGVGLAGIALVPFLASLPGLLLANGTTSGHTLDAFLLTMLKEAPLIAACFVITYAVLVALTVRAVSHLIRPGMHPDERATAWALWFSESLMNGARGILFPLYSSLYTCPWLRLAGVKIGKRSEVSTAVGLNKLATLGEGTFLADDVVLNPARARNGWLDVRPIEIGGGSFFGNGAIVNGGAKIGKNSLVGVLSTAPESCADGTSWFGMPPLELPRVKDKVDAARTTNPPRRLVLARAFMEAIRILLPATGSVALGALVFLALDAVGRASGSVWVMAAVTPFLLLGAGIAAMAVTVALKWLIIGRYKPGNHPLYSFFVWRDEIINSAQESLGGQWLLTSALGTPLMSAYLRAMGSKVGTDVHCGTMTITEFDLVTLGDGAVTNRWSCVETHLFHDRLMRIGPTTLGPRSTLGPSSALLPDTVLGGGATVSGRSVVMRGEELPPGSAWHGAPVVSM
jgi:non-ribosomal peptide synthetase-like protein